jgi:L-asparaginase II
MRVHVEVTVRRGPVVESRHALRFAACDPAGRLVASSPDPDRVTMFRSSAKPFQLLPLVERGYADRWGFGDEELAVMAASHTGTARHVELVRGILARIGLGEDALECGYHDPEDPGSLARLRAGAEPRSPLYNNCSGKHAGLLALVRSEGWPVEGYFRPEHPLQQLLHRTVAEMCGVAPESVPIGMDGCSLAVFALPLRAMARSYAALASAADRPGDDPRSRSLARIARAMTAHPRIVEGEGRVSTALMEATSGRLLAKGGAEGLQLVAWPGRGQGLALKCEDGAKRAVGPAIVALLEHLGWLDAEESGRLATVRRAVLLNSAGRDVGGIEAEVRAEALA